MEGGAPRTGIPRIDGMIMASHDIVALDAMAARHMGFDPYKIPKILAAYKQGIGEIDRKKIKVVGDRFCKAKRPFIPAEGKCLVIKLEMPIRRALYCRSKWLYNKLFLGPGFIFLTLGSWFTTITWWLTQGRKYFENIKKTHYLGKQFQFKEGLPVKLSIPDFIKRGVFQI